MAAKQSRTRQGIQGPDLKVPPGVSRILYPIFLPEWLETTRTSRMVVNGVAQVPDPQGTLRYVTMRQKTRMGFLPVGGLLKLTADEDEFVANPGESFSVPLTVLRSPKFKDPVDLELLSAHQTGSFVAAGPMTLQQGQRQIGLSVAVGAQVPAGEYELVIRASASKNGYLAVISEFQNHRGGQLE